MSITRNSRHSLVRIGVFTLFLCLLVISVSAQTNKGTISGTVTDQGGAVVQNAMVTVTNMDTAAERTVNTGEDGTFTVPLLEPGKYRITVVPPAALNLKNAAQNDVILQTTQTQVVNISLEPGSVGAEVTITAAPSLVESETSDRGSVVTGREVTELLCQAATSRSSPRSRPVWLAPPTPALAGPVLMRDNLTTVTRVPAAGGPEPPTRRVIRRPPASPALAPGR